MKTTIELTDELYRRVKARSAMEGKAVREVATSLFQQWADGMVRRGQYPEARAASTEDDGRRRRDAWLAEWQTLAEELARQAPDGGVVEQLLRDRR